MTELIDLIKHLLDQIAVSGCESGSFCLPFPAEMTKDCIGNIHLFRKGCGKNKKTILLEAHRDTVGLIVNEVKDQGFVSVLSSGGLDATVLPGTVFTVHGREKICAIATAMPPHVQTKKDQGVKIKVEDLYLDLSCNKDLDSLVKMGDVITYAPVVKRLQGSRIASPYLDNLAGVAALLLLFRQLENPYHDVHFLLSVGEETTSCGVRAFCEKTVPDLAFILDAGFGYASGIRSNSCIRLGKGPSVSMTDTLCRDLEKEVIRIANTNSLPLQVIAEPGGTGTSGTAIQTARGGIPCALISIPVLNMHSPLEICDGQDVKSTVNLLSHLVHCDTLMSEVSDASK